VAETKRHLMSESIEFRDGEPVATLAKSVRDRIERLADPAAAPSSNDPKKVPLWLMIEELMSDVSDEEMAQVPPANSRTIDEKLYGKKTKGARATK